MCSRTGRAGGAGAADREDRACRRSKSMCAPCATCCFKTVEQGDCGLDAMAFWDGSERTDKTWKALRLELAGALEAFAYDPVWQVALAVCGEVSPGEDVHSLRNTVLDTSVDRNTLPVDKNGLDARSPNKHAPARSERTPRTPNTEKHTHKKLGTHGPRH